MWFTEDALTPAVLLAAGGVFAVLSGWSSGRMGMTLIGLVLLFSSFASFGIDAVVITERERLESRLTLLCDDFRHKRDGTLDYFSDTVPGLQAMAMAAMKLVTVEDAPRITDVQTEFTNEGTRSSMHFRANAPISVEGFGNVGHQPSRFRLNWAKETDGWKIIKVTRLHPTQDRELGILDRDAG